MIPERNALVEHVYPKLKKVCREKFQLEFQVSALHYYYYWPIFLDLFQVMLAGNISKG